MSESGPMWLTRGDDVVAHLYFAAAEIGAATMELGALQVPGSLSFPNPEERMFSFFTHGEVDLSEVDVSSGEVVRFRYVQGESTYTFLSEIEDISDQQARRRWRIRFPQAIERNERRLVKRHRVMGRPGFHFSTGPDRTKHPLYDIAAAGLSYVVSASNRIKAGTSVQGSIHIPGLGPIAVVMEMRNLRPLPGDASRKLAGCRFVEVSGADRELLANALSSLS
jgi:hypothetical protein